MGKLAGREAGSLKTGGHAPENLELESVDLYTRYWPVEVTPSTKIRLLALVVVGLASLVCVSGRLRPIHGVSLLARRLRLRTPR
jgi:hypothetical protein